MKTIPQSIEPRIPVTDLTASIGFYRQLLDFDSGDTIMANEGFAILRKGKIGIQLVTHSSAHPLSQNTIWIDFIGVTALYENIKDRFIIEWGPEVYPYRRREFAVFDPDRHRIIFSESSNDPVSCEE